MTSGIIVAGGRSRRLGHDKRRLRLWGTSGPTLLEHTLAITRRVCSPVVIALNDPQEWAALDVQCVTDRWVDVGPLGGIAAGLAAVTTEWALVVAADLPLLDVDVLAALLDEPRTTQAVIPAWNDGTRTQIEPLHGIYRTDLLPALEAYVEQGGRSMRGWLATLTVAWWDPATSSSNWRNSFINLNTSAELEQLTQQ